MTNTIARIKRSGKNFEIMVNLDDALKFKKGQSAYVEPQGDGIFYDAKNGKSASSSDLQNAFGTADANEIAKKIVKDGEVLVTQEYREAEQDKKFKQVVDFLATNSMDPKTGRPHTPDRIKSALEQAHVNIKNVPIEAQMADIMEKISQVIPIKISMRRIRINIPAIHTGKAYGVITPYKEDEKWKDDGSLEVIVKVPAGIVIDFYDKLNSVTHGSALTEEIKE
ncbi:MAG: ribosome assembly factor SBDS [Nanoarchaeota archaeon]